MTCVSPCSPSLLSCAQITGTELTSFRFHLPVPPFSACHSIFCWQMLLRSFQTSQDISILFLLISTPITPMDNLLFKRQLLEGDFFPDNPKKLSTDKHSIWFILSEGCKLNREMLSVTSQIRICGQSHTINCHSH